jgi:isopentenyldiphosphate isomerase
MGVQRRGARAGGVTGPGGAERAGGAASAAGLGVDSGSELLAICDARGCDLGAGLPRRLVHQEGVWHRSFHCWLVRAGPRGAELVLQRRAPSKDTWPGAWDVSAAGHYRPGEWLEGGLREIAEELGIILAASALVWLERHREVLRYASGLWDREYQDVYLARCDPGARPGGVRARASASVGEGRLAGAGGGDPALAARHTHGRLL